jgi:hypothetical protein
MLKSSSTDPTSPITAAPKGTSIQSSDLHHLLWFSGGILALFVVVVVVTGGRRASTSRFRSIARIYALLSVAGLGVGLAFASLSDNARTAAFTVLGTIAGYLAGASGSIDVPGTGTPDATRATGSGEGDQSEVIANLL